MTRKTGISGHPGTCRCEQCTPIRNAYESRRRKVRALYGVGYSIPAVGTTRRIHALMALGWTSLDIATRCGWTTGEAVLEVSKRKWVGRDTASAIARAYDAMSMTPGTSAQTRARALAKGWAPPLAWDDIDDPDETPDLGTVTRGLDLDEWARLVRWGELPDRAAERCGVSLAGVEQAAYRAGRDDVRALTRGTVA